MELLLHNGVDSWIEASDLFCFSDIPVGHGQRHCPIAKTESSDECLRILSEPSAGLTKCLRAGIEDVCARLLLWLGKEVRGAVHMLSVSSPGLST